ncbi:MAG: SpoIID/LytB domain-containing protein [Thermoanaerobaculia bacterium]
MKLPRPLRFAAVFGALAMLAACATRGPGPAAARDAAAPASPTPTPAPAEAGASRPEPTPAPAPGAPSGVLFRLGLKSDLTEFVFGLTGQPWSVASDGKAETIRGPLVFRPDGGAAASSPGFQVQAGAFSQEEPARKLLERLAESFGTAGAVAFAAERGVYRVLLGAFRTRPEAEALAGKIKASGLEAFAVEGAPRPAAPAFLTVAGEDGKPRRLSCPVDVSPGAPDAKLAVNGTTYRGSLRVLVNNRATLNVVNRVDIEEYLYGVVPAEMGPRRYDAIEALKAQAVAARTYAFAHSGQFESEGYDLCATMKCQVYSGLTAEDPLSNAAVDATRGLVLAHEGRFADALFVSTCGGRTENVENVFGEETVPYLVSVECGELATVEVAGARLGRAEKARSPLEWRGFVLRRLSETPGRGGELSAGQKLAGVGGAIEAPATLSPAAVYPALVAAFGLKEARTLHLLARDAAYYAEKPPVPGKLPAAARDAYDFLFRFRFGAGEPLPPPDHALSEEEFAGLVFSVALRLTGVTEATGRFVAREGSNLWVKTTEGRVSVPVDPDRPLARRSGDRYQPASALTLRAGDRLRWWKQGARILALWVEAEAVAATFERESSWTEWVRRASDRELARRMSGRVAGKEVREVTVTRRTPAGRALELHVVTDEAEATFKRFGLRQALELPELLFTVHKARGPQGETEFVFLGRGWGHGVGLCQNGSYGMALEGAAYDAILKHYYSGIDIVTFDRASAGPPSTR